MRAIVAVIAAILVLGGALAWLALGALSPPQDPFEVAGGGTVDGVARLQAIELEKRLAEAEARAEAAEARMAALGEQVAALGAELRRLAAERPPAPPSGVPPGAIGPGIEDYAAVVLIPERRAANAGLTTAGPRFLEGFLGRPRPSYSDRCEPMTNPRLRAMLRTEEVGPIRVRMLQPAIDSLARIFERVRAMDPELHDRIGTAGSLCVRQIRGSRGRASSHSFGLAVDINIDGVLDTLGDGRTQLGLLLVADLFRQEGWIWGAAWRREDSMHFEVARETLEAWRAEGLI